MDFVILFLIWSEHEQQVKRMSDERIAKMIYERKMSGKGGRGKLRLT